MSANDVNESFRELCYIGDVDLIKNFYRDNKPNVNSMNRVNGWTALHWAVKRNHLKVIEYLIDIGADPNIKNFENKSPSDYVSTAAARDIIFKNSAVKPHSPLAQASSLPNEASGSSGYNFTPNYAKNPEFHYASSHLYGNQPQSREHADTIGSRTQEPPQAQLSEKKPFKREFSDSLYLPATKFSEPQNPPEYITVKIRSHLDDDFIEIDIDKANLTLDQFKEICNRELGEFDKSIRSILKVRKLPNVLVRNTADIKRFKNDQEIELVYLDQK